MRALGAACVLLLAHGVAHAQAPRTGELVVRQAGTEIGRERWRDDGSTLTSDVTLAGQTFTSTITRVPGHVHVVAHGQPFDAEVHAGIVALPNGQWEAYALLAEHFHEAMANVPIRVLVPGAPAAVPATATVTEAGGLRTVRVALGGLAVVVQLAADGTVRHAEVPAQNLVVDLATAPPPAPRAPRAAPAGVAEEAFDTTRAGVTLAGTLWMPAGAATPMPLAVIVAGSGPTDRDGNDAALGLRTDLYRKLAEALAHAGIASLRFDKRGVGGSGRNFDASALTLDDFVADAAAVVAHARRDPRFAHVTVIGHSEGGLIAISLARTARPDALVLVATPGRPMAALLREQLNRAHDPAVATRVDAALDAVRHDRPLPDPTADYAPLFAPGVLRFVRSELDVDPARMLHALRVRVAIVQGESDAQVSVADANALAAARRDARTTIVPRANHVLCDEASSALPQASYTDPARPLVQAAVDAVVAGVAR